MKFRHLFLVFTLFLGISGPLLAQGIPANAPPEAVLKAILQLTEDQVGEIRLLTQARKAAIQPVSEQVKILQRALEEELGSDAPDPLEVGDLVLEVRMLRQEIGQHMADFRTGFREVLTDTQVVQLTHIHRIALATRAAEALDKLGVY